MKTIFKILIFWFLSYVSFSCNYLDKVPDDELTLEMVFNDKIRTEDWLAGIYSNVPDPYWGNARYAGYDCLSDDMSPSEDWVVFNWPIINLMKGNWSPKTEWQMYYWSELAKRIRSAYIFIDNVHAIPSQKVTSEDVELMKAEARFLIAYYYWLLIDTYGSYPFTPGLFDPNASAAELQMGQTPFEEIVDWVDKELADVAKILPPYYTDNAKFGRATSVMCHCVRAQMLLFAASPLVNGNPWYADFVNNEGERIFPVQYDASKWERAAKACRELVNLAESNGYDLYKEYNTDGSIDPFMSYQNMLFTRWADGNREILFGRPQCSEVFEYDKACTPRGAGGNGGLGVTQSLVDAFFMENGYPIDDEANSGYVESGFSMAPEIRNTKWIEGGTTAGMVTDAGTYNMYCHREARFYISVLYNGAYYRQDGRKTQFMNGQIDGGPGYNAPQGGYLCRKKVHPDHNTLKAINPYRPGVVYRLGQAYLDYIECALECVERGISNEYFTQAMECWDKIRARAGLKPIQELYPGATTAQLLELYRKERRVELNNEGSRFRDIRRWLIGEETLNKMFEGMNFAGTQYSDDPNNPDAYFKRTPFFQRVFKKQYYFFPVPSWEMDKNQNLKQNPFWE